MLPRAVWLPGDLPPKLPSAKDFPLELWRTWFVTTGLYILLHWFTFRNNTAAVMGLCTPVVPANFGSFSGLIAIPLALLFMQAGEIVGAQIRSRLVRVLYNCLFLFWLTAGINVLSFGQWSQRGVDTLVGKESTMKPAKKGTQKSPKSTQATGTEPAAFTEEERAAMKERVQELKADARRGSRANKADGESEVLAKMAALPQPDRAMPERLHAILKANGPALSPKTWYGMPAYAKDGNVVCFFQSAQKFKTRYATLGFSDKAHLDEGHMWPTAFALKELTAAEEAKIGALVKKAVS